MPKFVSVLTHEGSSTVTTISEAFAKNAGLEVLDQPAVDRNGRPLPVRPLATAGAGDNGLPTMKSTNAEIQAYAADHHIDLGDATKKADMLDVIAASTSSTPVNEQDPTPEEASE